MPIRACFGSYEQETGAESRLSLRQIAQILRLSTDLLEF
jgi:hypothetical protein